MGISDKHKQKNVPEFILIQQNVYKIVILLISCYYSLIYKPFR